MLSMYLMSRWEIFQLALAEHGPALGPDIDNEAGLYFFCSFSLVYKLDPAGWSGCDRYLYGSICYRYFDFSATPRGYFKLSTLVRH